MSHLGSRTRRALVLVGVGAAYFGVAKLGLSFSAHKAIVSAVWPPSGLALAAAFVLGPQAAPAVFVGAFAADATSGTTVLASLGIAAGNAISSTTGGLLLRRAGFDLGLRRVRDIVVLAVLGAGISTAINATVGTGTLWAAHIDHLDGLWGAWRVWWLGDLTGVLIVAPLVLFAVDGLMHHTRAVRARAGEASVLLAALVAITLLVMRSDITLAFPVFPLIVLAALRFGQAGAVTSAFVVSTLGVIFTARGHGPFVQSTASADLLRAQVFVGLAAATGLLVAGMRSEWERAEDALARLTTSEGALAEAQRVARIGSWVWDATTRVATFSDEMYRILGLEPGEEPASYELYLERAHPEDREAADTAIWAAWDAASAFSFEHRVRTGDDDDVRTVHTRGRIEIGPDGTPRRAVGTVQDITDRRDAEERLAHQALHDPLTGLPNRALFLERLDQALRRAAAGGVGLAVFFCDIDNFKSVNDTLGHETGDVLLVAMAPRIRQALRPGDLVSRFGGDEFLVLCERFTTPDQAADVAGRLAEAFKEPFLLGGREHHVTASVGVVFTEGHSTATATELLRDADAAMYRAKERGRDRFEMFDASTRARLIERVEIEADLRHALAEGELRLVYQPVVSVEGELIGVEALVRWLHPRRGLLGPGDFMAVAEETGLVVPLGAWVIEQAVRQTAIWGSLRMGINLSPYQVAGSDVTALLAEALATHRVDPALLQLEITETVLLGNSESAAAALRGLKTLGVCLVLDDFGTGYSSLSHLKRHPIDVLKIDREFVDGLGVSDENDAIVTAVLSMAKALGIEVVAEGVETREQLQWLRTNGCSYAQGYLFAPPVPADELFESIRHWGAEPTISPG